MSKRKLTIKELTVLRKRAAYVVVKAKRERRSFLILVEHRLQNMFVSIRLMVKQALRIKNKRYLLEAGTIYQQSRSRNELTSCLGKHWMSYSFLVVYGTAKR